MNRLDVVIILIMAASIIYSLLKGFIKEVSFLAAVVVGLLAALRGYSYLAIHLYTTFKNPTATKVFSFLIILALVFLVIKVIGWLVEREFKRAGLSNLDRLLGVILGAVKGAVIVSALLLLLVGFTEKGKVWVAESRLSPVFLGFSKVLSKALPEDVREGFKATYENLQDPERLKQLLETLKKEKK